MSGLCGWFGAGDAGPGAIDAMAGALTRFDGGRARSAAVASGAIAAAGRDADVFQDAGWLAATWGKLRFADADLAALAERHGAAHALARGYGRSGAGILAGVSGAFAAAVLNRGSGEAMLAIDRIGTRPLCYAVFGNRLVFGSTLDAISAFPGSTAEIDHQALYDYVYFHMIPGPHTIHARRGRLLPGSLLAWRDGRAEQRRYWEMRFVENQRRPFPELKEAFLASLRQSVRET